ncbi:Rrf2 family transcriptional regulator [Ralstonia pickettii]|uniref:Rrf2 family transcriptional regulator n=1 Tax=Ralstonia pickettii TaxID=329 RepID=UPI00046A0AE9|nr:Rrf2 family transcriptional regulator [Ralstonia pickettii]
MSTSSRFAVAVHILTLLASAEGPVPSSLIAGSVGTNPALIRRLVAQLADAGFVISQMGATGGATLARPADRITLLDVFRVVESPVLIALPPNAPNPACEVGREITGVLERVTERAQAALEAELAAQTIAGILSEVGHAQRRRRRA